jgi:hypothetical protein
LVADVDVALSGDRTSLLIVDQFIGFEEDAVCLFSRRGDGLSRLRKRSGTGRYGKCSR